MDCSNLACNVCYTNKKNPPPTRTTSNNFTNYSVRPANLHNSRNNRISNVCTMVSQKLFENKKSASIFFSIVLNQPAWPQIYAADHRGLNVVTIYFMFLFYALGWQTLPLTLSHAQIFKWFCRATSKQKNKKWKIAWRERSSGKHQTNETIIPFAFGLSWICIRITIYYYCYNCTIFILSDEPQKNNPSKATVLDGHPQTEKKKFTTPLKNRWRFVSVRSAMLESK